MIDDPIAWGYAAIALSAIGLSIGGVILEDDAKDFGKFSSPDHPSPFHHWQLGLGITLASAIGMLMSTLYLAGNLQSPKNQAQWYTHS